MTQFLREAATVAIAGATMVGLIVTNTSSNPETAAFVVIAVGATAAGVVARIRRRSRTTQSGERTA